MLSRSIITPHPGTGIILSDDFNTFILRIEGINFDSSEYKYAFIPSYT